MRVTVEVLATKRGPLFEVDRDRGRGLSLRNASTVLGDLGFESLLPLLRARTVDDVDQALDRWVEPVNNVVIADTTGAVRSVQAIVGALAWRQSAPVLEVLGDVGETDRESAYELGGTLAALVMG